MTTKTKLAYGTYHVTDLGRAAWGARLIFGEVMSGGRGIVGDRVDWFGTDEDRTELLEKLNDSFTVALRKARDLRIVPDSDEAYTLFDDGDLVIVASPQSSYGYLYLTAVLREPKVIDSDEAYNLQAVVNLLAKHGKPSTVEEANRFALAYVAANIDEADEALEELP